MFLRFGWKASKQRRGRVPGRVSWGLRAAGVGCTWLPRSCAAHPRAGFPSSGCCELTLAPKAYLEGFSSPPASVAPAVLLVSPAFPCRPPLPTPKSLAAAHWLPSAPWRAPSCACGACPSPLRRRTSAAFSKATASRIGSLGCATVSGGASRAKEQAGIPRSCHGAPMPCGGPAGLWVWVPGRFWSRSRGQGTGGPTAGSLTSLRAGKPTGEAYVEFESADEAARAMRERQHENMGSRYIE